MSRSLHISIKQFFPLPGRIVKLIRSNDVFRPKNGLLGVRAMGVVVWGNTRKTPQKGRE